MLQSIVLNPLDGSSSRLGDRAGETSQQKIRHETVPVFFGFHILAVKIIGNQMKMHSLQRRSVVVPHVDRRALRDRGQKMFFNVLF